MEKSNTTPVAASSFPKWESSKHLHVIDEVTGKELHYEPDPLSLEWHNVNRDIKVEEMETLPCDNKTSLDVPVPVTLVRSIHPALKIVPYSKKKSVKVVTKMQACIQGASSMVDVMSLVKKHLNKSKTNIHNKNSPNHTSTSPKYQDGSNEMSKNSFENIDGIESSAQGLLKIKQEPLDDYAVKIEEEFSYIGNIKEEPSNIGLLKIKQEPLDTVDFIQSNSQEHTKPKVVSPSKYHTSFDETISNNWDLQKTDMNNIKLENTDSFQSSVQDKNQSCSSTLTNNDTSCSLNSPSETLNNCSIKQELGRIDKFVDFGNRSTVMLNSSSLTSEKPVIKHSPQMDKQSISDKTSRSYKDSLALKYSCFNAESKAEISKRPDMGVLFKKTKMCRHSNYFKAGEIAECGCVKQGFLKCDLCSTVVRTSEFMKHVKEHYKIKRYRCPHCSKVFKGASKLDYHIRISKCVRQKYQCFKCQEEFNRFSFLKHHLVSCTGKNLS